MITLDFTDLKLGFLITHHIGNKLRDEGFKLSSEASLIQGETLPLVLKYFLSEAKNEELYSFTHPVSLIRNDAFVLAKAIFDSPDDIVTHSQSLAKLLYSYSMHPKVKGGELNVTYFTDVHYKGETTNAIGLFKSETNIPYLKMNMINQQFVINHDYGYEIKNLDKGCIIFETNQDLGYEILLIDTHKSLETQYWKDSFLKVTPITNDYNLTKEFLSLTKEFLRSQRQDSSELSRTEQIDLINRSVEYFKTNEKFELQSFESNVIKNENLIKSFRNFDENYREENSLPRVSDFTISNQALKKQSKSLKNVLKLDKNFDVYIHNSNGLIEQGVDEKGRKFYKLYYQNEF